MDYYQEYLLLHRLLGPDGWMWRVTLPLNRLVVYYGNPFSAAMGPIGAYSDNDLLARLQEQAQVYAQLDPAHPVIPALDYVTPVAQGGPTADGTWRARMPDDSIEHYRQLANSNHMLFFMDMQVAHSSVQDEVNAEWPFLEQPGVDLALDPEFDMPPGTTPGVEFGRMTATEINWVIDKLSDLVQTQHLPPKILIIHQFRESMLPDWQKIRVKPGVEIVTSVDGFGTPGEKIDDYRIFDKDQLIEYPGFKLFYTLDKPLMSPSDVLKMDPPEKDSEADGNCGGGRDDDRLGLLWLRADVCLSFEAETQTDTHTNRWPGDYYGNSDRRWHRYSACADRLPGESHL
jgi:hypothetical protein